MIKVKGGISMIPPFLMISFVFLVDLTVGYREDGDSDDPSSDRDDRPGFVIKISKDRAGPKRYFPCQ